AGWSALLKEKEGEQENNTLFDALSALKEGDTAECHKVDVVRYKTTAPTFVYRGLSLGGFTPGGAVCRRSKD
ncbi:hypothetical protein, partial [Salmonella enterica]|uniref:hypothetical protein n=1 Tax=Salmonella enterica TaxID=28901 RepID=UPI001F4CF93C